MADGVMRASRILGAACCALALLAWTNANADDSLADPTRPPPGFAESAAAGAPAEPPLTVTSLFLMGTRPYAVVDGQIVHVGDRLAQGRVSRIDARGVWLRQASGQKLLKLLPGVEKVEKAEKRPSRRTGKMEK